MAGSSDNYIPRPDAEVAAWSHAYYEAVFKFYDAHGLPESELFELRDAIEAFNVAYAAHTAARAAAQAARQDKLAARATMEMHIRSITGFVQGLPVTTNPDRAAMGITLREMASTRTPAPVSRPRAIVNAAQRLTHTLRLVDESTPTRRARPRGTLGAEVYVGLTAPGQPAHEYITGSAGTPGTLRFLGLATSGSLQATFTSADAGQTAVYLSRWVSTRGEKGPWSDVTTATVAA